MNLLGKLASIMEVLPFRGVSDLINTAEVEMKCIASCYITEFEFRGDDESSWFSQLIAHRCASCKLRNLGELCLCLCWRCSYIATVYLEFFVVKIFSWLP